MWGIWYVLKELFVNHSMKNFQTAEYAVVKFYQTTFSASLMFVNITRHNRKRYDFLSK